MIRERIHAALREALAAMGAEGISFVVERPRSFEHGDLATNAALVAKVDANELAAKLKIDGVEKIEVVGKFINFFLSRDAIVKEVEKAATDGEWGRTSIYGSKKIMVEYTDPNPFKEFHIGHLMSNALGESIARLLDHAGARVVRANYQGDVGPHVAKAIWGKMQKPEASWGEAYICGTEQYETHKEEIDAINKKVYEQSDDAVNKLYAEGREQSLKHFEELYRILGTKFDHYFFESETAPTGLDIVKKHPNVFEESDGAIVFRGENYGLHTRVFVNKLGLPTYEAKDLGLAELKKETTAFDISITITANEQDAYFKVVFKALELIHPEWRDTFKHASHGLMRFAEGKMSSRKGNVITGEALLFDMKASAKQKMQERSLENIEQIAEQVAVGAIKYSVLKQGSGKDIIFDPEKSLSLEGDSGPYLQYAHTRALSLIAAAKETGITGDITDAPQEANTVERTLLHFPNIVERAAKELEPHYVTTYLTELAGAFNSWYANERIIGGSNPHYGVLLTQAVEKTLAKGLQVLGILAPEKM